MLALMLGPAPLDLPDDVADVCEAVAWFRDTELSYTVASTENLKAWAQVGDPCVFFVKKPGVGSRMVGQKRWWIVLLCPTHVEKNIFCLKHVCFLLLGGRGTFFLCWKKRNLGKVLEGVF